MPKEIFLATTALEDFWDPSNPIVFLGEWCRRYSRKSHWEALDGSVLKNHWHQREDIVDAHVYILSLYERVLPQLAEILNNIHDVRHSVHFWRIIIGPWLWYYLPVLYDRFGSMTDALDQYPSLTTIGLPEGEFVTPRSTMEFIDWTYRDLYNLQIFTRILTFSGLHFPKKSGKEHFTSYKDAEHTESPKNLPIRLIKKMIEKISQRMISRSPIIVKDSCLSKKHELLLSLKTRGSILSSLAAMKEMPNKKLDLDIRSQFEHLELENSPFEKLLSKMIALDVPQEYVESFPDLLDQAKRDYPCHPKAIFSANAWYYDEVFKVWAASSSEKGTKLLGTPHGGAYGFQEYHYGTKHELEILDRLYSWGWSFNNGKREKIVPMPATKLIGRRQYRSTKKQDRILMTTTIRPRYTLELERSCTSMFFSEYLNLQSRFINSLGPEARKTIRVRLHKVDWGNDLHNRWKDHSPDILMESWDIPFSKSLEKYRLCVFDHLSTTCLEALAINKPAILFWNSAYYSLTPLAAKHLDELRRVGILFDTPEDAAKAVNEVYSNVVLWWEDKVRQNVVKSFCHHFARTSQRALDAWGKELMSLIA